MYLLCKTTGPTSGESNTEPTLPLPPDAHPLVKKLVSGDDFLEDKVVNKVVNKLVYKVVNKLVNKVVDKLVEKLVKKLLIFNKLKLPVFNKLRQFF